MDPTTSWILHVQERLATPPPRPLQTDAERHAALVALYVDAGQLWVLLSRASGAGSGGAVFPSAEVSSSEEAWQAARRAASTLEVDSERLMPLGELDHVAAPTGETVVPCVAVVPPPQTDTQDHAGRDQTPLPLVAARSPSLVEERTVQVGEENVWVRIAHIGPVTIAGAGVEILENLLERVSSTNAG
ncbi:MAG: hypothetical protein VYE73_12480 [Acidobacteriota bacterium]|nr:hypothetical protein [Acidobacteriota bacterium]